MSAATMAPARAGLSAKQMGWAGVVLGVIAWYVTLPPLLVRTPLPSLLLAARSPSPPAWRPCAAESAGSGAARSSRAWSA